jgi:hypothetical protein
MWLVYFLDREKFEFFIFTVNGYCIDMSYTRIDKFLNNLDNNAAAFSILMVRSLILLSYAIFP